MTLSQDIAPLEELKEQAKRLRRKLRDTGVQLSHGQALELVAHQHGVRDWNTLHAMAGNRMRLRLNRRNDPLRSSPEPCCLSPNRLKPIP